MLVVDASAVAELLLDRPASHSVASHLSEDGYDLHAPHLLDVEVISVLRRLVATGDAPEARADDAVIDLLDLPIERYGHEALTPRIWQLRENFSAYDAAYVALAEVLAAPLLTTDGRLARGARNHSEADAVLV